MKQQPEDLGGGGFTCAEQFHKLNRFESVQFLREGLSSKTFPFSGDNLSFKGVQQKVGGFIEAEDGI